ncbi:MAG: NAD-glutamate dehydrogenase, partial [Xanthobacteraceae bacterium]
MAAADLPGSDEELAEAALSAAAEQLLGDSHREIPADFVAEIFAHAVPEDLLHYDPRQLAELAADAWSLLAVRKPGVPNIRLDTVGPGEVRERRRNESVLEIVNDDMPFLVDSVLAELADRGVDVRFVVHPVLTVERDKAGRLIAIREAKTPGALRESVIYMHLEPIEDASRRA